MKKVLLIIFSVLFFAAGSCLAYDELRGYSEIEVPQGTFIPVLNKKEISTLYYDVNSRVEFVATNDLYLQEINIVPKNTTFYGYIEQLNEPVIGTNASMKIKIVKMVLPDGFEVPIKGYIYTTNGNLIGGELTEPAKFVRKAVYRKGFKPMTIFAPGGERKMGEHTVVCAGAEMLIILVQPLFVTHTVIN